MKRFDYLIVGGGIVGLAVCWNILRRDPAAKIALLEKEDGWARHQSGRNSGVIHSGIYYKPGSLKARLCREGNLRMRGFCEEHGIQHEVCGKVIVATRPQEMELLANLQRRAVENGLGVVRLTKDEVLEREPHVRCLAGLFVPSTGITDYAAVSQKLADLIAEAGGELHPGSEVKAVEVSREQVVLETDRETFSGDWLVNCAGLHSDRLAEMAGSQPRVRIVPFRGEYYELKPERRRLVNGLVYPVPDPEFPFLGVHFTRMIDGSVHAGPNAVLSFRREGYLRSDFDFRDFADVVTFPGFWRLAARHLRAGLGEMHRSLSKAAFVRSLQRLIPEIEADDLVPSECGVRAQALSRDGRLVDDFMIVRGPRATHVCNAPSPAATASLEIGGIIAETVLSRSESVPA